MALRPRSYRALLLSLMLLSVSADRSIGIALEVGGTLALTMKGTPGPGKDAAGRAAWISAASGTNRSTAKSEFMNGAAVVTADTADLVNGTGPHHGWVEFSDGANSLRCAWKGQITTVLGADDRPRSTAVGTWTVLGGSGRYAGARGQGTYRGRYTSSSTSVMDWAGSISP